MKAKLPFFDDYYVAARPKTERRVFSPERLGEFHDVDALLQLYTSFFFDPYVNKYRLYYESPIKGKGTEVRALKLAMCDSIDELLSGKVEITTVTGIDDLHGIHGASVTYVPDAEPSRRYIFLGNYHADNRQLRNFICAFSADGISFSTPSPVYPEAPDYKDTYNSVYYDPYRKELVATTRCATVDRRIAIIHSHDGIHWSEPELMFHPSSKGNWGEQHYALGVSHLDGIFYGILWRFITDLDQPDFTDMGGLMENDLLYSYDGRCFAPTDLSPLVTRPPEPIYGCKQLWLLNMEQEGDRYVICGGASRIAHGSSYAENDKFAATVFYGIRKDGFCALEGRGEDSIVYLKPILFEGGDIILNTDASSGSVSLAITEVNGDPIEGFGFDDCYAIEGKDTVEGRIAFRSASLDSLSGRRVRFAIRLNNALLYSVSFEGRPFLHASRPQHSFNDPRHTSIEK